jgi:cell division protein FtsQ
LRPVSQQRRAPKPRGQSGRTPSRGIKRASAQPQRGGKAAAGFLPKIVAFFTALLRRPMLLLTLFIVIVTAVLAVVTGRVIDRAMARTDRVAGAAVSRAGFGVTKLHLDGNVRTKSADIMAALGVRAGQPIFNVDVREARLRLLQLPWVAETDVMRRYPDDISVHIVERTPYARWQTDKGLVLVERQGRVILPENNGKFAKLPLLMGEGAPIQAAGFVEAVSRYRGIVKRVSAYQYQSGRRWNLLLDDGVVVKLPETGWQKELPVLEHLIVDKGVLESDIREVDLRNPLYFYFQLRNGVEHKEKRSDTGSAI